MPDNTTAPSDQPASPWCDTRARADRRNEKREAVLRTAVRHFNTRGFRATSLDGVAAELRVTKPTIYHYFRNKDDILFECVRRGLSELQEAAAEAMQTPGAGIDRLRRVMLRYARIMTEDFGRSVTLTADTELSPDTREKFRALKREIDLTMRSLVQEGIDDGSIRGTDARIITFTLTGALNWIARWYRPEGGADPDTVCAGVVDTLMQGLRA